MAKQKLIEIQNLKVYFPIYAGIFRRKVGYVRALDDITLDVYAGETLGLVGESGCGKSTCGRALLQLHEITAGSVRIDGTDMASISKKQLRTLRPQMQMVFQDPQASLNPRMTVAGIIAEPLNEHTRLSRTEKLKRVYELMDAVGLHREFVHRYPHEFSGGQRQRIGIARALALNPKFLVCDEPIAALDVSIQAQVVNLFIDLQKRWDLTYLFISHDLSMVRYIADRVAVMYLGRIAELARRDTLYAKPQHPYTQALLSAVPEPDPRIESVRRRILLEGDVPSSTHPPAGCHFCTRCAKMMPICRDKKPDLIEIAPEHFVACHLYADSSGAHFKAQSSTKT